MPILYVHGVATRDSSGFDAMKPFLRRYVAPAISSDPANVLIDKVYWGDVAARFAWDGRSRPRTMLLRQGGADTIEPIRESDLLASLITDNDVRTLAAPGRRSSDGTGGEYTSGTADDTAAVAPVRLAKLSDEELSDVLSQLVYAMTTSAEEAVQLALAADELARDASFRDALDAARSAEEEADIVVSWLDAAMPSGLVAQGPAWLDKLGDRLSEALSRGRSAPAVAASVVVAEGRPWLNDRVSVFIGDVFVYLRKRGTPASPGEIQRELLGALDAAWRNKVARGGEALVVLTHSMGGQLVYDAVTFFLPQISDRSHIKIDFWCATASQVGFFEELKLFGLERQKVKYPDKMPFPKSHLGCWWNVWDHNDIISFTAKDIFEDVDDEPYHTGVSLIGAHSAYLTRPSFFRRLAAKLAAAKRVGWTTP